MSIIADGLSANATIASDYDRDLGKPPAPKIATVTCADPRLSNIDGMLGLGEADVDMIRNFGTVIDDDAIRDHSSLMNRFVKPQAPHPVRTNSRCAGVTALRRQARAQRQVG
jgi:carbonic anhydrase